MTYTYYVLIAMATLSDFQPNQVLYVKHQP